MIMADAGQDGNRSNGHPRIVAGFEYRDERGTLLYQAGRGEPGAHGERKDFRQRRPGRGETWIWDLENPRRVLYRLPELLAADPELIVFVAEGEKCVERL